MFCCLDEGLYSHFRTNEGEGEGEDPAAGAGTEKGRRTRAGVESGPRKRIGLSIQAIKTVSAMTGPIGWAAREACPHANPVGPLIRRRGKRRGESYEMATNEYGGGRPGRQPLRRSKFRSRPE
jgi:hypothetical protein